MYQAVAREAYGLPIPWRMAEENPAEKVARGYGVRGPARPAVPALRLGRGLAHGSTELHL